MLDMQPVRLALHQAQETHIRCPWGEFYARLWDTPNFGCLAYCVYYIGEDIQIHRNSPGLGMSETDAAAWIQQAYEAGPQFLLPLLEVPS